MTTRDHDPVPFWIYLLILAFALPIGYYGCPQPNKARQLLEAEGYKNIHVNVAGGDGWSCGEGDMHATGFTAERQGVTIEGVVCCGVFKACTIRLTDSKAMTP